MEKVIVYQNPYQDILVELRKKEGKKLIDDKTQQERQLKRKIGILMTEKRNDATVGSIGKYIGIQKMGSNENVAGSEEPDHIADSKEKKVKSGGFSNFDGW